MTDTPDLNALSEAAVPVTYTNWLGKTKSLRLILSGKIRFGTTNRHETPTWLISGFDVDHPARIWKEYDLTKTVFDAAQLFTTADVEANTGPMRIVENESISMVNHALAIEAAVEAEREACAVTCASEYLEDPQNEDDEAYQRGVADCVISIRARGDSQ